jgi:hypothetical protein
MPVSLTHEVTVSKALYLIQTQLDLMQEISNEPVKRLTQDINMGGSRNCQLYGADTRLQPDGQFVVQGSYFPGVVLEVAHSQDFGSLQKKAENLIVKSKGKIQLVIGLETAYKISAWRSEVIRVGDQDTVQMKTIVNRDVIQDADGNRKPGSLVFHLKDFGTDLETKYPGADLTKAITLDYQKLAEIITTAHKSDVPFPN